MKSDSVFMTLGRVMFWSIFVLDGYGVGSLRLETGNVLGVPVASFLLRATTGGVQGAKGHSCPLITSQRREGLFIIGVVLRRLVIYIYIYK